jgi:hypothetical protein
MRFAGRRLTSAGAAGVVALVLAGCSGGSVALGGGGEGTGSTLPSTPRPGGPGHRLVGLTAFDSCSAFVDYVRDQAADAVTPFGLGRDGRMWPTEASAGAVPTTAAGAATTAAGAANDSASAPTAAGAGGSSTTNTQEAGVDEGDLTENDGRRVFAVVDGRLRVVDVVAGKEVGDATLPPGSQQLLLDGDRLAVITGAAGGAVPVAVPASSSGVITDGGIVGPGNRGETVVSLYDVSTDQPRLLTRTHLEGAPVAARAVAGRAQVVVRSTLGDRLPFVVPATGSDRDTQLALDENRQVVLAASAADWLPRAYTDAAAGGPSASTPSTPSAPAPALSCDAIARPSSPSGLGIVWVADVDLTGAATTVTGSAGVVATGETVYASASTLYVATTVVDDASADGGSTRPAQPEAPRTAVHAFDLAAAGGAAYEASGAVPGVVLDKFALSESDGTLRIATTRTDGGFGRTSETGVHVLRRDGGQLDEIGSIGGLGRGERVYAVRYVGALGYVVTFRQTDPLYVLDFSDPAHPTLQGELKIPGYSAYLQGIGDGRLLGVGQDATAQGRRTGAQLALFDVHDPADPQRGATLPLGDWTAAEGDHHAVLWWPATGQVMVPAQEARDMAQPWSGLVVAKVDGSTLSEQGRISHTVATPNGPVPPTTVPGGATGPAAPARATIPIERALVVDGRLVTVSSAGVLVSDLASLQPGPWIPFTS